MFKHEADYLLYLSMYAPIWVKQLQPTDCVSHNVGFSKQIHSENTYMT